MTRRWFQQPMLRRTLTAAITIGLGLGAAWSPPAAARPDNGNVLIADQFNNRVIEVNRSTHGIVWSFGTGSDIPGPHTIIGVNDAERIGPLTLMSGTGTPPGFPGCSDLVNGCPDNRVIIVSPGGEILWQYGKAGVGGSGPNELNTPVHSLFVTNFPGHPGAHVLITDQVNERIILVNLAHKIVWQYGTTGVTGSTDNFLNNPNSAEVLENGHILIADENNNRAIEVSVSKHVLKTFSDGRTTSGVAFASRLDNGDTLLTDSNNSRAVEVDANDGFVWQYITNLDPGSNPAPLPTRAIRLRNGDTLISDQFNDRVIEVTPAGGIVFTQGSLNAPGSSFNQLNGPYDAKVIGDFTGLTPPFGF
ncbi:hypothetical protein [Dyella subtropica]|uniref:hypothetical protein n=1 Tax=Dyella subtropica TaxID=2992127 RepID=UPI0022547735|nr:hypothetical protein [Dyella subtropica]